ncbi:c-type cytochrome [Methylobrevis pamukkalensis]|uniref:Cytochrome c domain-containing protein n=1 Tax=Methylobrevis pamukkalensis TaxID=1439726 RepID=A0A1E3GX77_9HYPH|nr:sulfide dehydrogenase [Methylobrevis pamukkalensis]ODN68679.1 hypothetical protein A6302_04018 [Methylobrevis pamukkalensis]
MAKPLRAALAAALLMCLCGAAAADERESTRLTYLAGTCNACHGSSITIPALAGRPAPETAAALRAWRDGSRVNPIMNAVAGGLDDDAIDGLADLFAHAEPIAGEARP